MEKLPNKTLPEFLQAKTGTGHSSGWRGDEVGKDGIHYWLRQNYGKPEICENPDCLGKHRMYQWALLRGKNYERRRENFWRLCIRCHSFYDGKVEMMHAKVRRPVVATKNGTSQRFNSIRDASKTLGIWPTWISNVLAGRGYTAKGFSFEYAE